MIVQMSALGNDAFGRFGNKVFSHFFLQMLAAETGLQVRAAPWLGDAAFDHAPAALVAGDHAVLDLRGKVDRDHGPLHEMHLVQAQAVRGVQVLELLGFFQYHSALLLRWQALFRTSYRFGAALQARVGRAIASPALAGRPLLAVHLRRGDYVRDQPHPLFWGPSIDAVVAALHDLLQSAFRNCVVYVGSDDLAHCQQALQQRGVPCIGHDQLFGAADAPMTLLDDFAVMASAQALLVANSSLSVAAAMLNTTARVFLRPCPARDRFIPFDPWNSHVLLRKQPVETEAFVC